MTENTRPLRDFMQSLPTGSPARLVGTDLTAIDVSALLQDGISSVSAGAGISINPADPKNPIISVDSTVAYGASAGATAVQPDDLSEVATTGSYNDLDDKPSIPSAQVNSDWNASSGVAQILNKPVIPAAQVNADWDATSGVAEILNKPALGDLAFKDESTADLAAPRVATLNNIAVPGLPENTPYLNLFAPEPEALRAGLRGPNHMVGTVNQTVIFEFPDWAAWSNRTLVPQATYPATNTYTQHLNAILQSTPWGHAKPVFDVGGLFDGNGIRYFRYTGSQPLNATITGTLTVLIKSHLASTLEPSRIGTVSLWLRNPGSTNNIGENQNYLRLAMLPGVVARSMNLMLTDTTVFPDQAVANVVTIPVMYTVFLQPGYSYEFAITVSDWDDADGAQLRNREKVRVIGGGLMMNLPIPLE